MTPATGLRGRLLIASTFLIVVVLASDSDAQTNPACFEQQQVCGDQCIEQLSAPDEFDVTVRCICQCGFAACECSLGGLGYAELCVNTIAQICNDNLTGILQSSPVLPNVTSPGRFQFENAISGMWVDPPPTDGFFYTMTGDSLFTSILEFPTGFSQPFIVRVGEQELGSFVPGNSVSFESFAGGGVDAFEISGIAPEVDSEDPAAFPLRLSYNTAAADFIMTAPEPGALSLGGAALAVLALRRRGRQVR